jgi:hypothetical protein
VLLELVLELALGGGARAESPLCTNVAQYQVLQ